MKILYLDQNKWIELAQSVKSPEDYPEQHNVLARLVELANAGLVAIPLTSTNLYETQKINIAERRTHLAWVQATLSQGLVFRGRHKRLEKEVTDILLSRQDAASSSEPLWFLSQNFIEATADVGDPRLPVVSKIVLDAIHSNPPKYLFEYLTKMPEVTRASAISIFSDGSKNLLREIEERRTRDAKVSLPLRRKLHSARLMINELDLILSIIRKAEIPNVDETEILKKNARRIINESPTYFIEREIGLRIEAQTRALEENDLRDMQAFCAVVAYADIIVAENMFSNLAVQAGLQKRYKTHITTSLLEIPALMKLG